MSILLPTQAPSKYRALSSALLRLINKSQIITDPSLCFTLGTDASFYRLTPKIIVKVNTIDELVEVLKLCAQYKTPYTFRAAGTSLSGQAVSDSVLITLTDNWTNYKILENGNKIRLQPGIIGAVANSYLAPLHKKIGPDPASIDSCKIGGIAANNASGMCCGTAENSYQTLSSMTVVLADGSVLNTADILSVERFKTTHAELLDQLSSLRSDTKNNQQLKQLIKHKYRLKNTTGFSINALIDFQDPIDILQHLMIGSEGCLGFIADITYRTVVKNQYQATSLLVFPDIQTACDAVSTLIDLKVAAAELIDGRALQSINDLRGVPKFIAGLDLEATALLLECQSSSIETLNKLTEQVSLKLAGYNPIESIAFTSDPTIGANLWQVRKGLFPAVGAIRKKGTSVIIEDVAFPLAELGAGTMALRSLLIEHGYHEAIIFGHALVGNLHFVISHDFSHSEEIEQYRQFMQAMTELVAITFKGSLKGEHGTGRNMAPFVELEWGAIAYKLMLQIKMLFDPDDMMNPGVIVSTDRLSHIKNLKQIPIAHPLIDQCIECGFCEAVCPSRNLTLSPRQRIVMYRQIQQLHNQSQTPAIKAQIKSLSKKFDYLGIDTCAATGLCADQCPVGINTGDLIRSLRQKNSGGKYRFANFTAKYFAFTTAVVRGLFRVNQLLQMLLPAKLINAIGMGVHKLSHKKLPLWLAEYPTANNSSKTPSNISENKVVYIPSCASRSMGTQGKASDQRSLSDVTISLLEKAGYQVIIPREINQLCCGMPYHNNGMEKLSQQKNQQFDSILWQSSQFGKLPILIDTSPCKKFAMNRLTQKMQVFEPCEFAEKYLIDKLAIQPLNETIMLFITCSSRRMELIQTMVNVAKKCVDNVVITDQIQCCAWAGNKGFTTPELNREALHSLKEQVPEGCNRGFSNSISCEIGLSHHSGIAFQSILYLLDEVSLKNDIS